MKKGTQWQEGTFGSITWGRCLHAFPHLSPTNAEGLAPFETAAEKKKGEAAGTFVGYLNDETEKFCGMVRNAYLARLEAQVRRSRRHHQHETKAICRIYSFICKFYCQTLLCKRDLSVPQEVCRSSKLLSAELRGGRTHEGY